MGSWEKPREIDMALLTFGNFHSDLLDPLFGFGDHFPSEDMVDDLLSQSVLRLRDPATGATIALSGSFVFDGGFVVDGTVTGITLRTGSGALLLDWTRLSISIWDALFLDPVTLLAGNDTILGGSADDVLLGFGGDDLVRGNGGNDLLIAIDGRDTLEGGAGIDVLISADDLRFDADLYPVGGSLLADGGERVVFTARSNLLGDLPFTGEVAFFRAALSNLSLERVSDPFMAFDLFDGPAISGDGRFLTVVGSVGLAGLSGSNYPQLLLFDFDTGAITVESRNPAGDFAGYMPNAPTISADGGTLAFVYLADDLVANDTNGTWDVFYKRVGESSIARASVASDASQSDAMSAQPVLSGDGSLLAFVSAATNLTPDSTGVPAAYLRNLDTGEISRIAEIAQPRSFSFDLGAPPIALSTNGRYLAFVSARADLVPGDTNGAADVFVRDLATGETVRASVDFDGEEFGGFSDQPAISGDGRFVAFVSPSSPPGLFDGKFGDDVFVKDMATTMLYRIPVPGHDFTGAASVTVPQLAFDGQTLLFRYASDGTVLARFDDEGMHLLKGGPGDDIYLLTRRDTVVEASAEGENDIVVVLTSRYVLPDGVEGLAHPLPGDFEGIGNAADNLFLGGPGNDRWDGRAGLDTLYHLGRADEVTISRDGDWWRLSHAAQGVDEVTNVERVVFANGGRALDVEGNAGHAVALWYAALAQVPTATDVTPWIAAFDAGQSFQQVAQTMLDTFAPQVGGISDELLVTTLWNNIVRTPLDQPTRDLYLGLLTGGYPQAALFADAARHPWNESNYAPLIVLGVPYQPPPFDWSGVIDGILDGTFGGGLPLP